MTKREPRTFTMSTAEPDDATAVLDAAGVLWVLSPRPSTPELRWAGFPGTRGQTVWRAWTEHVFPLVEEIDGPMRFLERTRATGGSEDGECWWCEHAFNADAAVVKAREESEPRHLHSSCWTAYLEREHLNMAGMPWPSPRIEVIGYRDPDDATTLRVFIGGVEVRFAEYVVDPGSSGCSPAQWRRREAEAVEGMTPAAAAAARAFFDQGADTEFVNARNDDGSDDYIDD